MDRRAFLGTLVSSLLAAPIVAEAQPVAKVFVIGWLGNVLPPPTMEPVIAAFMDGLRQYGYVDGTNLKVEYRWANGRDERYPALVRELIQAKVQLVVTAQTPAVLVLKEQTKTLPVVLLGVSHPVEAGLVQSLARPGGNITGVTNQLSDLDAKLLQLGREIVPKLSRIGVFWTPTNQGSAVGLTKMQEVATKAGVAVVPVSARTRDEAESAFLALSHERLDILIVHASYVGSTELVQIRDFAARNRMPTISAFSALTHDGLLMSYSPDLASYYRRAAYYVDKILKGAKPADLPVEQPTKFELVINLKTAKALGLTIPPSLLLRADQVIE
jgi:putative ABC transport system substrate-binding protein